MTDLEKVARMALKTLEYIDLQDHDRDFLNYKECHDLDEAITALHQALSNSVEQPAQQSAERGEPVDWEAVAADQAMTIAMMKAERKPWVGLTDDEIGQCLDAADGSMGRLIAAIEAKLKEKNT